MYLYKEAKIFALLCTMNEWRIVILDTSLPLTVPPQRRFLLCPFPIVGGIYVIWVFLNTAVVGSFTSFGPIVVFFAFLYMYDI